MSTLALIFFLIVVAPDSMGIIHDNQSNYINGIIMNQQHLTNDVQNGYNNGIIILKDSILQDADPLNTAITPTPPHQNSGGGSGGSSGGGSGVITDEDYRNIDNHESQDGNLLASKEVRFGFNKIGKGIFYIIITGKENEYDVTLRVENLKGQPKKATTPAPNATYLYTNIISSSQRGAGVKIGFKVPNTWLASEQITPEAVRMYRLQDDKWNALETKLMGNDTENSIYEATTQNLSKFAIVGEVHETEATTTPAQTTDAGQTATEQTAQPTAAPKTPGFGIVFGLIGLLAAASRK